MSDRSDKRRRLLRRAIRVTVTIGVLAAGAGVAYAWSTTSLYNPGNTIAGATVGAPTGLGVVPVMGGNTCTTATVSWTAATNANRYLVEAKTANAVSWTTLVASHATTSYPDITGYTNRTVTWRITPFRTGTSWTGTSATVTHTCGVGEVSNVTVTNPCTRSAVTWTAASGANNYDVLRRVNGAPAGGTTLATNQAGTTYSDTIVHATGALVEYWVVPGNGATNGVASNIASVSSWDSFRVSSVTFANSATLGAQNAGDTVAMVFTKPVNTATMTNTTVRTRTTGGAGVRGVYISATNTAVANTQGGFVNNTLFSAAVNLTGNIAWTNGNQTWTWTSTSAGVTNMSAALSGPWAVGTNATRAKCAADGTTNLSATPAPTLGGRW